MAIGLLAPLAVAVSRRALGGLDDEIRVRDADIETLRAVPMLETLPVSTIEQFAATLEHAEVEPGHTLVRQGERGEYFYIVRSGRIDVLPDGRLVRTLGAGECFGEIAGEPAGGRCRALSGRERHGGGDGAGPTCCRARGRRRRGSGRPT